MLGRISGRVAFASSLRISSIDWQRQGMAWQIGAWTARAYNHVYNRTLRGNVVRLLGHAKHRGMQCILTHNDVLDMLWAQRGRCYYSDVPMEMLLPNSHWRMSLERVDNSQGYSTQNCVLIASEFNTSDYSRNRARYEVYGTAQWSREKVAHVWGPSPWAPPARPAHFATSLEPVAFGAVAPCGGSPASGAA